MSKIFAERKINAECVLPISDMKLYSDITSDVIVKEKAEKIILRAEKALDEPIPFLHATVFLEFVRTGNRSHYEVPVSKRRSMLLDLMLAEAYERQGRFVDKLADVVWATLEESTWVYPAHLAAAYPTHNEYGLPAAFGEDRMHGIDIFSAPTAVLLALAYSLLKKELDGVSPAIAQKILYELKNRIIKPYINCTFWWTGERGNKPNNWCPWSTSNILFVTALVEEDLYTRKKVVSKALRSLDTFTAGYKDDGGCDEGPSYWNGAGASYFDCLEILYDMTGGAIDVYDHPLVRAICEYVVKFNIDGKKRFINFADCAPYCHPEGSQLVRMGEKCGSDILIPFGISMAQIDDIKYSWTHMYRGMKNLMTKTPNPVTLKAAKNTWFPDLKVMISRESEDPSVGLFVAMKGGTNDESHNHNDVGNVVVYYNGNPVLIDTGAGRYTKKTFSAQRYELWYMQSLYHNVASFGGKGQCNGAAYYSKDEVYDEASGGCKMQLAEAYPKDVGVISYTRECVLLDGAVRITDEYSLQREEEAAFRFITHVKPTVEGNIIGLAEGRTMTFSDGYVQIEELVIDEANLENAWKTPTLWIINVKMRASQGRISFAIR